MHVWSLTQVTQQYFVAWLDCFSAFNVLNQKVVETILNLFLDKDNCFYLGFQCRNDFLLNESGFLLNFTCCSQLEITINLCAKLYARC